MKLLLGVEEDAQALGTIQDAVTHGILQATCV
jgi:hypothetical protein